MSHISPQQRLIFSEVISTEAAASSYSTIYLHPGTFLNKSFIRLQQNKENSLIIPLQKPWGGINYLSTSFHFHRVCWVLRGAWGLFLGGGLLFLVFIAVGWLGLWGFFAFFNLKKNSECITIVTELGLLLQQLRILLKLRFTG